MKKTIHLLQAFLLSLGCVFSHTGQAAENNDQLFRRAAVYLEAKRIPESIQLIESAQPQSAEDRFYFNLIAGQLLYEQSAYEKSLVYLQKANDRRKYILKKYVYTINHKKLGLSYFVYALVTAIMGSYLATCIRLEMAYPGSPFFNGDSLKYLQVMTAHALIMIFFVVVPIFFGGFANYFLPYHVGSKDVAYPRLNNLGF
jgi:tetratricopeptide (TPR) repeat protein